MRPFGGKPNIKTMWAWPKANNIISFKAGHIFGIRASHHIKGFESRKR
jgi:hypothetical protein